VSRHIAQLTQKKVALKKKPLDGVAWIYSCNIIVPEQVNARQRALMQVCGNWRELRD